MSSSILNEEETTTTTSTVMKSHSAAIIGAGPAGLATAIMLARSGRGLDDIHVYERLSAPAASDDESVWSDAAKFYLIGLGGRGQKALRELDDGQLWDRVEECCVTVVGRKDWAPGAGADEGVERIFGDDRPYKTKVIPRDRLSGVLRDVILESYGHAITLHYDTEMTKVRWEEKDGDNDETAVITLKSREGGENEHARDIRCELLVGADGTARTIAEAMESETETDNNNLPSFVNKLLPNNNNNKVRIVRYEDDNRRVYKTVPMTIPSSKKGWRNDVNYSARTKDGRVVLDALPSDNHGVYCAVLLLKADDEYAQPDSNPQGLRALVDETLPQFSPLISDETILSVAAKSPSNIPRFRYVGPALHKGSSTVLLGDAIHTVKPYFGLGVNSALEDVLALRAALDEHPTDRAAALFAYTNTRAEEAEALVRISRALDRPGFLGFVTFILPIIMDGIFQNLAPQWFELNTIALLQRDGISFAEVGKIKRRDRLLQIALLVFGAAAVSTLSNAFLSATANIVAADRTSDTSTLGVVSLFLVVAFGVSSVLRVWEPGMAPADVLSKTLQPVTDVISAEDRGTIVDDDEEEDDDDDDDRSGGSNSDKSSKNPLPFIGKGGLPLL
eukprot:CAMPEP_0194159742 /NCGR_PEP_ID=MMETSP0152-20130528/78007_1 /TAXON_ID=1049557 /ORGANISM="Thalassiothrix antarctica, Strain L6-D1" /LENGTH=618 /DNA_ID=CAMNT_0038869357 /DNA_START=189 /DNA_END=2045 /DNA_ORIENTATION=+